MLAMGYGLVFHSLLSDHMGLENSDLWCHSRSWTLIIQHFTRRKITSKSLAEDIPQIVSDIVVANNNSTDRTGVFAKGEVPTFVIEHKRAR